MVFLVGGWYNTRMEKIDINTIEWRAPEYNHKNRGIDFLWTIGLIALASCIIAVWLGNYIFGIFILLSGACLIFFTAREPEEITFSISNNGVTMGRDVHAWKIVKSFNIKDGNPYDKLIIETTKKFLPLYTIPLPQSLSQEVKTSLIQIIPNTEIDESPSMLFMEKLGF